MTETNEKIYKDAERQVKCIREYLLTCHDPEDQRVLKQLIASLRQAGSMSTKKQMAAAYKIDVRTFKKRMIQSGCAEAMLESKVGEWKYDTCKMFTPQDIELIYKFIGTPKSY